MKILNHPRGRDIKTNNTNIICSGIETIINELTGPTYNGEYLHKLIRDMTQDTLLS